MTVLATLLWDAKKHNRLADRPRESTLAKAMITKSDNDATSTLWKQLGLTKIKGFLAAAGMTQTKPGRERLLGPDPGHRHRRAEAAQAGHREEHGPERQRPRLHPQVDGPGRLRRSAGAHRTAPPSGVSVHVKNGWLQRSTHGWRVHSVGTFKGGGHDYMITVLTHGNSTMNYGITTIQGVAKAIHKDLAGCS